MVTANQIVLHLLGDYVLQSHWMATNKTKLDEVLTGNIAALAHVLAYTAPFALLTQSWLALGLIAGSHFVIDRYRLARYVVWAKNFFFAPPNENPPWSECSKTGYPDTVPPWLSVWLLIITDNIMHIVCNAAILRYIT